MADQQKKFSILHIITRLDCGGSAENTLLTAIGSVQRNHKVTILYGSNVQSGDTEVKARNEGVYFVQCKYLIRSISPFFDLICFFYLLWYLNKNHFDIIHTHTSKAGIIGRFAGICISSARIVHTPHGHIFYGYFKYLLTKIFIILERVATHFTDAQIHLTKQEKNDYLTYHIGKPEKMHVIHSGICIDTFTVSTKLKRSVLSKEFGISDSHFVLVTVARLVEIKNHAVIIKAATYLKNYSQIFRFLFVGDGELHKMLKEKIKSLGLSEMFIFAGWRQDVASILSECNCFTLCSKNEGMGRVFVEAQAAGIPVIGSRICGIPEVVQDGVTGFLIDPDDAEALAEVIQKMYHSNDLLKSMAQNCRSWVSTQFSVETMVESIEKVYQSTFKKK